MPKVYAFIDANSDGDFLDVGEQAAAILVPGDGSVTTVNPSFIYRVGNLTGVPHVADTCPAFPHHF